MFVSNNADCLADQISVETAVEDSTYYLGDPALVLQPTFTQSMGWLENHCVNFYKLKVNGSMNYDSSYLNFNTMTGKLIVDSNNANLDPYEILDLNIEITAQSAIEPDVELATAATDSF